jgi:hypothetical protein
MVRFGSWLKVITESPGEDDNDEGVEDSEGNDEAEDNMDCPFLERNALIMAAPDNRTVSAVVFTKI